MGIAGPSMQRTALVDRFLKRSDSVIYWAPRRNQSAIFKQKYLFFDLPRHKAVSIFNLFDESVNDISLSFTLGFLCTPENRAAFTELSQTSRTIFLYGLFGSRSSSSAD